MSSSDEVWFSICSIPNPHVANVSLWIGVSLVMVSICFVHASALGVLDGVRFGMSYGISDNSWNTVWNIRL